MNAQDIWDLHEKTRQGKNPCPTCDKPKKMSFSPWCPACEKPEIYTVFELDCLRCLMHLEAIGHIGIQDRLWDFFIRRYEFTNGASIEIYFIWDDEHDPQTRSDLNLIKSTWSISGDSIRMFFSW